MLSFWQLQRYTLTCSFFVLVAVSEYACILALLKCRRVGRRPIREVRVLAKNADMVFGLVLPLAFMMFIIHHYFGLMSE